MVLIIPMNKSDYSNLDFKALGVMKLVYDEGSLSAAAAKLGQNQSSISYTIDRLRAAFADPLFVRAGRGIEPTTRCRQIIGGVGELLDSMAALAQPPEFNPLESGETIVVSCNHLERSILMPDIIRRLQKEAPGVHLRVVQSMVQGHRQLSGGSCDILLSPVQANTANLYRRKLFEDRYVCVVAADHPLANQRMTMARYQKCRHVAVTYDGGWRPLYMEAAEAHGMELKIAVEMPSSGDLLGTVEGTELVLTIASALTRNVDDRFKVLASPFDARVTIYQFWNTRTHHSAAQRWMRNVIAEEAGRLRGIVP